MTPIPFDLPSGRILPPTVAYAAGLVCEHRPDLADGVRRAVLDTNTAVNGISAALLSVNSVWNSCDQRHDKIGSLACERLCEIIFDGIDAPKSLHRLADILGLIPQCSADMQITRPRWVMSLLPKGMKYTGDPTIGDVIGWGSESRRVVGLGDLNFVEICTARDAAELLEAYLRSGWNPAWKRAALPGEREALRRLIPLHAHTVSLDPAVRAAWAKAHLDALA